MINTINTSTANEFIKSHITNSGYPAEAWDTYSAGEELLDYMDAYNVNSFESVPEDVITNLLNKWDRQDAYSQDMAEKLESALVINHQSMPVNLSNLQYVL